MITNNNFFRNAAFWKNEIILADRETLHLQDELFCRIIHVGGTWKDNLRYLRDEISAECINELLTDYDIPADKRAFLYNIYNDRSSGWSGGYYMLSHIDFAIKHSTFQKKWQIDQHYSALNYEEETFLRKSRCNFRVNALPTQILQAIKRDSVSELEIARLLNNKKISLSIMYAILTYNAGSTINFLLKKYSDEIFSLRTPQEWLFTLCNYFHLTAAIDFIKHIEEKFPGIVKNATDPWGNNLLWHTFYNDKVWNPCYNQTVNSIQQCLIDLGCDPNKRNALGLSFNLVMENLLEI